MLKFAQSAFLVFCLVALGCSEKVTKTTMMAQYPSPMAENARKHERLEEVPMKGTSVLIDVGIGKDAVLYVREDVLEQPAKLNELGLLIHFHGPAFIVNQAAESSALHSVSLSVSLGAGSSVYERPLMPDDSFDQMLAAVAASLEEQTGLKVSINRITLSAFSAGYGSVRAILRHEKNLKMIDAVILMDGLHASYVPERKTLADGGLIDSTNMAPFVAFARQAAGGDRTMLITHSEIFPGTYASTTETAEYLLRQVGATRTPVLAWGPLGTQQLSEARLGRFVVKGFAGNTAPDPIDHLHAMPWWVDEMERME